MRPQKSLFTICLLVCILVLAAGCAQRAKLQELKVIPSTEPVTLQLQPSPGWKDTTEYHSRTITKAYSNSELIRKIQEDLDFTVNTEAVESDTKNKSNRYKVTTVAKAGKADLADYAMPELGESIEFTLNQQGQVLKAGTYPPGTIFFVPPISLPNRPVKVGDTWPLTAEWVSFKSGIPLRMQVASTLKSIRSCQNQTCAEIEISGDLSIMTGNEGSQLNSSQKETLNLRFQNQIQGKILFAIQNGTVLYSILKSEERLTGEKDHLEISSCILSFATEPPEARVVTTQNPTCHPNDPLPDL